ncbi:hypothetical protein B0T20DRAFT_483969 [Sordaria brevicollis]|uniref:Uncharacterized protein n=1 Tax=Sordaria brevicollis TaxID=83679 RepID=A0AAE0U3D3_SORBR|nr:hypothetical protein B0T20DRAFT_483969 [Sordaria brevicollis]
MEQSEYERGFLEWKRKRAQTLGERPRGDYLHHTHPHPDAPPTTLSSFRHFPQHNDISSSTDSGGNQEFGHTYDGSGPHHTRSFDRDVVGGNAVTQGCLPLRTRSHRSATVPNDRATSRPYPLTLGAIKESPPRMFHFEDDNTPGDDDDNRTFVDPHDTYNPHADPYAEGAGCLKPPTEPAQPRRQEMFGGPVETYPDTPPEANAIPEREPDPHWDGVARSEPPFEPMFMRKHFDPRVPNRYGRGPQGRR